MNKKKNILITGGSGFIGSNFLKFAFNTNSLENVEHSYSSKLNKNVIFPSHKIFDITDNESVKRTFEKYTPDVVINFAAHRDANTAERQRSDRKGSVWKSNVIGIENLYKTGKRYNSYVIHISTDMVFSGKGDTPGPYNEKTKPEKYLRNLSWYGWTKAEGERRVYGKKDVAIIRIGNVTKPTYDPKLDYIGKMLYLFDKQELYPLFTDQFLTLSSIPELFQTITALLKTRISGVFHVSSKNLFTPHQLGEYLIKKTRGKKNVIKGISIDRYLKMKKNRYPKYGGLLSKATSEKLNTKLFTWEDFIDLWAAPHFKK